MTLADQVNKVFDSYAEIAIKQPEAINLLHSVYKRLFGQDVKKSCGDCNVKAFRAIQKHVALEQNKGHNLETMKQFKDRNFVLKKSRTLQTEFGGTYITNDNLTDEAAVKLLLRLPNLLKHFDKYPKDEAGQLDLTQIVAPSDDNNDNVEDKNKAKVVSIKPAVNVVKTPPVVPHVDDKKQKSVDDKVNTPPHKRNKELRLPNEGESIKDAAARYGVNERTIQRDIKTAEKASKGEAPDAEDEDDKERAADNNAAEGSENENKEEAAQNTATESENTAGNSATPATSEATPLLNSLLNKAAAPVVPAAEGPNEGAEGSESVAGANIPAADNNAAEEAAKV